MFIQSLTLRSILTEIPTDTPALIVYFLVIFCIGVIIAGSMKKTEPVSANWRANEN